jgi:hypothetical protein
VKSGPWIVRSASGPTELATELKVLLLFASEKMFARRKIAKRVSVCMCKPTSSTKPQSPCQRRSTEAARNQLLRRSDHPRFISTQI